MLDGEDREIFLGRLAEHMLEGMDRDSARAGAVSVLLALTRSVPFDLVLRGWPTPGGPRDLRLSSREEGAAPDDRGPWETILVPNPSVKGRVFEHLPPASCSEAEAERWTAKGRSLLPALLAARGRSGEASVLPALFALHALSELWAEDGFGTSRYRVETPGDAGSSLWTLEVEGA